MPADPTPPADILQTARSIADAQISSGAIPWPDGHIDPWDHVESAMALSACGLSGPARRAYRWLRDTQRADGSWPRTTGGPDAGHPDQVTDRAAESHHAAYVAVGVWHEFMVTADRSFVASMWPVVRRATGWVLDLQTPRGEVAWERDVAGRPGEFALLSGCSSILQGLRCAIAIGELMGEPQPDWELASVQLGHVLACHPEAFAEKGQFAMDWYYPVLAGALRGAPASERIDGGWDTFVVPGLGSRCVSDQPWVTAAETCELVLSLDAIGRDAQARELFRAIQAQRHHDGSYWTGWQFVNRQHFPDERSSWTAAAVVLAADALTGFSGGAAIFRDADGAAAHEPVDPEACGCAAADVASLADGLSGAFQDPQRAHVADLGERTGVQRPLVDAERRLAALVRIGEHVVDGECPADGDPRRPALVVPLRGGVGVAAVDEQHAERRPPQPRHVHRTPHDHHHVVVHARADERGPEPRQRVNPPGNRVHQRRVVVLPALLVLLRAPVVVDRHDLLAHSPLPRVAHAGRQVNRRLAAVTADLQHRAGVRVGLRRLVQCQALGLRHEPRGDLRRFSQLRVHSGTLLPRGGGGISGPPCG
jgi:hypothetical protein